MTEVSRADLTRTNHRVAALERARENDADERRKILELLEHLEAGKYLATVSTLAEHEHRLNELEER